MIFLLYYMYRFQYREDVLFMQIPQAISRTTGPNIGIFVLNLINFQYWFQIWSQYFAIVKF